MHFINQTCNECLLSSSPSIRDIGERFNSIATTVLAIDCYQADNTLCIRARLEWHPMRGCVCRASCLIITVFVPRSNFSLSL